MHVSILTFWTSSFVCFYFGRPGFLVLALSFSSLTCPKQSPYIASASPQHFPVMPTSRNHTHSHQLFIMENNPLTFLFSLCLSPNPLGSTFNIHISNLCTFLHPLIPDNPALSLTLFPWFILLLLSPPSTLSSHDSDWHGRYFHQSCPLWSRLPLCFSKIQMPFSLFPSWFCTVFLPYLCDTRHSCLHISVHLFSWRHPLFFTSFQALPILWSLNERFSFSREVSKSLHW